MSVSPVSARRSCPYSRIVSKSRYRVSGPVSAMTSERATQACEQLEHLIRLDRPAGAIASAASSVHPREHRQASQEPLFWLGQEFVGPVDRGAQRLVAFDRDVPAATADAEPPVEAPRDSLGLIVGMRAVASSIANAMPSRRVHTARTSAWLVASTLKSAFTSRARSATIRTTFGASSLAPNVGLVVGESLGTGFEDLLSHDVESFAARGEHPYSCAGGFDRDDEVGHRAQQMLAVVQDKQ